MFFGITQKRLFVKSWNLMLKIDTHVVNAQCLLFPDMQINAN